MSAGADVRIIEKNAEYKKFRVCGADGRIIEENTGYKKFRGQCRWQYFSVRNWIQVCEKEGGIL